MRVGGCSFISFQKWRSLLLLRERSWIFGGDVSGRLGWPLLVFGSSKEWVPTFNRSRFLSLSSTLFVSSTPYTDKIRVEGVEHPSQSSRLMQQTVQWLQERSDTDHHRRLKSPWNGHDVAMAQSLLQQWYNDCSSNDMAPRFTSLILQRWLLERNISDADTTELMHHLHRVLHLWQRKSVSTQHKRNRAYDVLQSFHHYSVQRNEPRLRPAPKAYSMVFETLSNHCTATNLPSESLSEMIVLADQLLEQMNAQYQRHVEPLSIRSDLVVAQNSYLYFRVKSRQDPERSEQFVLQSMQQPNAKSFAAVLQHWVSHSNPDRACALLERMLHNDSVVKPDRVCFNICLQGLGYAGEGPRAQALLGDMIRLAYDDNDLMRPNEYSYLAVINAWAKCQTPVKAVQVLEQMIAQPQGNRSESNSSRVPFTSTIYTTVLDAVARQPNSGSLVEAMLQRMEEEKADAPPGRQAYTIAIRAWGNTKNQWDAPDRATDLLRRMHNLGRDLAPCSIAYTSLIHAWAQSERNEAPHRALTILRYMEHLHLQDEAPSAGANRLVSPDTIVLNVVLSAFSRHGLAAEAHQLLDEMKQRMLNRDDQDSRTAPIYPNVISWATVIQAYINSRQVDSARHAYDLLLEIEDLYDMTGDPSLRSTPDLYALVILAQDRNVVDAESILWRMVDRYRRSVSCSATNESISTAHAPNTYVCNALLRVWSKSDDPVAPQRAESILRWMEDQVSRQKDLFLAPDQRSFQFVMDAWNRSRRRNAQQHVRTIEAKMELKYPHLRKGSA